MKSINFNTGLKEFAVNGDESRIIRFNPSDINILKRFEESESKFEALQSEFEKTADPTAEMLVEGDKKIRNIINDIFGNDVCTPAFGTTNCLSPTANGFLFVEFVEAMKNLVENEVKATVQASQIELNEKTAKYTTDLDKPKITTNNPVNVYADRTSATNAPDISNLSPEQKQALLQALIK